MLFQRMAKLCQNHHWQPARSLVGAAEQRERESDARAPCGLEVDDQPHLSASLDRQIGRLQLLAAPKVYSSPGTTVLAFLRLKTLQKSIYHGHFLHRAGLSVIDFLGTSG